MSLEQYEVRTVGGSYDGQSESSDGRALRMLGLEMLAARAHPTGSGSVGRETYELYQYDEQVSPGNVIFRRFVRAMTRDEYDQYNRGLR